MMLFLAFLVLSLGAYGQEDDFISPVYELGGNVPPILPGEDVKPGKPAIPELVNRFDDKDSESTQVPPSFVLGSNPPVSHITILQPGPIVPPGEPWPAYDEKTTRRPRTTTTTRKATTTRTTTTRRSFVTDDIINRFDDKQTTVRPSIVLDYKPTRPSFHPNPGNNIGQIVPSGEPWPADAEGYENFGSRPQSTTRRPTQNSDEVFNRFDDKMKPNKPMGPGYQWPEQDNRFPNRPQYAENFNDYYPSQAYAMGQVYKDPSIVYILNNFAYENPYPRPSIVLDYKPQRPFYHPNPGNLIGQIIPPGEPWPAS